MRHHVTEHWDEAVGDIAARTCSCGERWYHDETRCPEDDGRADLVDDTCWLWAHGLATSPNTDAGLRLRIAIDRVVAAVAEDFDADERAVVKRYVERITAGGAS